MIQNWTPTAKREQAIAPEAEDFGLEPEPAWSAA